MELRPPSTDTRPLRRTSRLSTPSDLPMSRVERRRLEREREAKRQALLAKIEKARREGSPLRESVDDVAPVEPTPVLAAVSTVPEPEVCEELAAVELVAAEPVAIEPAAAEPAAAETEPVESRRVDTQILTLVPQTAPEITSLRRASRPTRYLQAAAAVLVLGMGMSLPYLFTPNAQAEAETATSVVLSERTVEQPSALAPSLALDPVSRARSTYEQAAEQAQQRPAGMCPVDGASSISSAFENTADIIIYPMAKGTYHITSPYGWRSDPFTAERSFHLGVDMAGPRNTPIYAAADGVVLHAGAGIEGRSNNVIVIEHNVKGEKFYTWYVHMYDDGVYVKEGQHVKAGQIIAGVGSNGYSTGPHLHFEVHNADNKTVDPITFLRAHKALDVSKLCNK